MLSSRVSARRHVVDGQSFVVLHDRGRGGIHQIDDRAWTLLTCCDGTRDLDGVVWAASRAGAPVTRERAEAFLAALCEAGLLDAGGAGPTSVRLDDDAPPTPDDRPLEVLPGYALRCDGAGACCRVYATILFKPVETARARALRPDVLDAGTRPERVFLPVTGGVAGPVCVVASVDGACAFHADGGCSIHARGGSDAKPDGCSLFPVTFVDDGVSVRVSVAPECACAFRSAARDDGDPLVATTARTRAALPPAAFVAVLPPRVRLSADRDVARAALDGWSRAVTDHEGGDVIAALWSLADAVARGDVSADGARVAMTDAPWPDRDVLTPWIEALGARCAARADEDARWRSARDIARCAVAWMTDACVALLAPGALDALLRRGARQPLDERTYVRASAFGHHWIDDETPLCDAIRDAAVRLLVARAMHALASRAPDDPAAAHPLALVEAMLRGHGLASYVGDVATAD